MLESKNDAFPVDENLSGIRDTDKIKIAICYMLASISDGLMRDTITSAMHENKIANFFEVGDALEQLLNVGAVADNNGRITVTENGMLIARDLKSELSTYRRSRLTAIAQKSSIMEKRKTENSFDVVKVKDNRYRIDIKMLAGTDESDENEMLSVTLFVSNSAQADLMRKNFYNNPTRLFENVIDGLTSDSEFRKE